MYLDDKGNVINGKSLYTHYAVGVPGHRGGYGACPEKWGTMPLDKVIAPPSRWQKRVPRQRNPGQDPAAGAKNMGQWPATTEIF